MKKFGFIALAALVLSLSSCNSCCNNNQNGCQPAECQNCEQNEQCQGCPQQEEAVPAQAVEAAAVEAAAVETATDDKNLEAVPATKIENAAATETAK